MKNVGQIARKFFGKVIFVHFNAAELGESVHQFGVSTFPAAVVLTDNSKYVCSKMDALEACVQDFLNGKLSAYVHSQPIPEQNDGPVHVVVGTTFQSMVSNDTTDVFIEFYAPWCKHCQALEPVWEDLGLEAAVRNELIIAKFDGTNNDLTDPLFEVDSFPTIYFKAMGKNPVKYEGDKTLDDFLEYLHKHSSANFALVPPNIKKLQSWMEMGQKSWTQVKTALNFATTWKAENVIFRRKLEEMGVDVADLLNNVELQSPPEPKTTAQTPQTHGGHDEL